jgi:cAMP phosphodiesterase
MLLVYAAAKCMDMMENHYFNGETWANFGDEGRLSAQNTISNT